MKHTFAALTFTVALLTGSMVSAKEVTVKLAVKGLTCASCLYIVKETLASIEGVLDVKVANWEESATVTFDDTKTSVTALTAATAGAGFPSTKFAQSN